LSKPSRVGRVYVIGAGLAGLSAAVRLVEAGRAVTLIETARQAGGRCRSYHDAQLGLTIDNGNHFVASGNHAVNDYLALIGASDRLTSPDEARFDFVDLADGAHWALRPNAGRVPWWMLLEARRVPGTKVADYLRLAALLRAKPGQAVGDVIPTHGVLWDRLLEPFFLAALNTAAAAGSAELAGAIIRETMARGGDAYRPRLATPTLAAAFVDPALAWLQARGAEVRLGTRLRSLTLDGNRAAALNHGDGPVALGEDDRIVMALPAPVAAELLPGLTVPDRFHAIVNAHFAVPGPANAPLILAVLGGTAEWLVAHDDRISVTVSCADALAAQDRDTIARTLWSDIRAAYGIAGDMPRWQVIKEARATFAATPEQNARRPGVATRWRNIVLAGDWTATGLPATIEGSLRSGVTAARLLADT